MKKWRTIQTSLLCLAVVIITASLFVALPAVVPAFESVDLEKVTWACTYYGIAPVKFDTWTWILPGQPDKDTWIKVHIYQYAENDIRDNLHRITEKDKYGAGGLNISLNPGNEDQIIISGYLHYGHFLDVDDPSDSAVPDNPVIFTPENEIYRNINVSPGMSELILDKYPLPLMEGILPNRTINITIKHAYKGRRTADTFQVRTDENGFFTEVLEPDKEADYYTVYASFEGETIFPKSARKQVEYPVGQSLPQIVIEPEEEREPVIFYFDTTTIYTSFVPKSGLYQLSENKWAWAIPVLLLAACIYVYFRYFRKRLKYRGVEGVEEIVDIKGIESNEKVQQHSLEETSKTGIVFPEIELLLPNVWGVGISLRVNIEPKDGKTYSELRVDWGDHQEERVVPDVSGKNSILHIFTLPGEYVIKAAYKDNVTGDEITGWRKIRIVDYREEMVRLFGEMLEELNLTDIRIGVDMTPREVERLLYNRLERVPKESIRQVIDGFEEANYSTHQVYRESYVKMYRAIQQIIGREVSGRPDTGVRRYGSN